MKNLTIHALYLIVIGFLVYQVWTKTQAFDTAVGSIEQLEKLLQSDYDMANKSAIMIKNEVDKSVQAYLNTTNKAFGDKADRSMRKAQSVTNWLTKLKTEFINRAGGFDKKDSLLINNRLSSKLSDEFFDDTKIQTIKDSLKEFRTAVFDVSDPRQLNEMKEVSKIEKLLTDETYWKRFKNRTNSDVLAQLEAIKNQIWLDEIFYVNYIHSLTTGEFWIFNAFRVAFAPKKAAVIEGEKFEMDTYLANYSSNPGSGVTFWVNNQQLSMQDGVAHFQTLDKTVGKKTISVMARIQNPLTGAVTTSQNEFEYEVLPKCSQNCQ